MSQELYYTAPADEVFEEIKTEAIKIWQTYDDTYGYASEKIGRIKDIKNIKDNAMYMVAMFDPINIGKLLRAVSEKTMLEILARAPNLGASLL